MGRWCPRSQESAWILMPRYFSYGSNMAGGQLSERCPSMRFLTVAWPSGDALAFTRWSTKRQCNVADVVPEGGAEAWVPSFELSDQDLLALDGHEGANLMPPAYRIRVDVERTDGTLLSAQTYQVATKSKPPLAPNHAYIQLLLDGARHRRLPADYVRALEKIEVQ